MIRLFVAFLGACFGFVLCWAGAMQPELIRRMLLLQDAYLYLMMASAVAVGLVGLRLLRLTRARAFLTGEPLSWSLRMPERRHAVGAAIFGVGWSIADACPGPIAGQLGLGNPWSMCTIVGVMAGVELYLRHRDRPVRVRGGERRAPTEAAAQAGSA